MRQAKLNPKQEAFVREYCLDFNGTQAAIRAGYSSRSAQQQATDLLLNPFVAQALTVAKDKLTKKVEITAERILEELHYVAFGKATDAASWQDNQMTLQNSADLSEATVRTIASIEEEERQSATGAITRKVRVKHYDKLRALELLGRYKGLFVDRKEITGAGGGAIQVEQKSWLDVMNDADEKK